MIARVAVLRPVDRPFDYAVPPSLTERVRPGVRVWAPFGARSVEGIVLALDPPDPAEKLKPISRVVDAAPIAADLVQLAAFIADYYVAPPGEVLRLMLPAGGKARGKRWASLTARGHQTAALLDEVLEPAELADLDGKSRAILAQLTDAAVDATALDGKTLGDLIARGLVEIEEEVRTRETRKESFLRAARPAFADELRRSPRRAQVYERIAASDELAASELDPRERAQVKALVDAGLVIEEKRAPARAVGRVEHGAPPSPTAAQSRALAPIEAALEKGEYAPFLLHGVTGSGKTEIYLRAIAHALERKKRALVLVPEISLTPQLSARFRGRFGESVAVLHSALSDAQRAEAFARIQRGEVRIALGARSAVFAPLADLGIVVVDEEHDPSFKQQEGVRYHGRDVALVRARAAGAVAVLGSATPSLEAFHAAREGRLSLLELPERPTAHPLPTVEIVDLRKHKLEKGAFLSGPLERALAETLAAGEQAILFLNRRGFSTFVLCKSCGQSVRCRDCSVALTWHRADDRLKCHYCGFATPPPRVCPGCGARTIELLGYGTEQVEQVVHARFPTARVARLDRDTAAGAGLERVLDGVRSRAIDVVVGTQMVTKGHDFPHVTLVGVILADQGMGLPDFRADERTFQLLVQVAGRAGRAEKPGRVIVQTFSADHPAVTAARDHDYHRFAEWQLAQRRDAGWPPELRLACVHVDGADPQQVRAIAEACAQSARATAKRAPAEARCEVLDAAEAPLSRLKGRTRWQVFLKAAHPKGLRALGRAALTVEAPARLKVSLDVDPISML